MTQIKIEVPANDHIALNAFAEALQRIAAERAPSTTMSDMIKQFENVKTPKGDDYIEQVIDETSSVELTPTSGEKLYDAEIERMDAEYAASQGADDTLDADGIPHDKRIHSKGATRLADDTWRLKRKPVDKTDEEWDEYVKSVKAELKAVQDIPSDVSVVNEDVLRDMNKMESDHMKSLPEGTIPSDDDPLAEQAIADLTPDQVCEEVKEKIESGEVTIEAPLTPPVIDEPVTQFEGVTPPVIDEPVTQFEGVTPPVIDEPTTQPPVAPVTPPTNLTPPEAVQCTGKVTPVMCVPVNQPSVTTFQELMLYITSNAKKRGADNDMIRETLLEVDPALTAIPLIATRADLIPKFVTALEAKLS